MIRLPFHLGERRGVVEVVVAVNEDPAALGAWPAAKGFPYCRATIEHPARGYAAALGWIQLVRSSDAGPGFAIDPFEPLGATSHPFAFFGFLPELFDAPSRDPLTDLEWEAHSFLARLSDERTVEPVLGFSWGFRAAGGTIAVSAPVALTPGGWDAHVELLAREHPGWAFVRTPAPRTPARGARPPRSGSGPG